MGIERSKTEEVVSSLRLLQAKDVELVHYYRIDIIQVAVLITLILTDHFEESNILKRMARLALVVLFYHYSISQMTQIVEILICSS